MDNKPVLQPILLSQDIIAHLVTHVSTSDMLDENGYVYGRHVLETYTQMPSGDCILRKVTGEILHAKAQNINNAEKIVYQWEENNQLYTLTLTCDVKSPVLRYIERIYINNNTTAVPSLAPGTKTAVSEKYFSYLFNLLQNEGIRDYYKFEPDNEGAKFYFFILNDFNERIFFELPESFKTCFPVVYDDLPTVVKNYFDNNKGMMLMPNNSNSPKIINILTDYDFADLANSIINKKYFTCVRGIVEVYFSETFKPIVKVGLYNSNNLKMEQYQINYTEFINILKSVKDIKVKQFPEKKQEYDGLFNKLCDMLS